MANYTITTWTGTVYQDLSDALTELEAYLETVADTGTLRTQDVLKIGQNMYQGYALHE